MKNRLSVPLCYPLPRLPRLPGHVRRLDPFTPYGVHRRQGVQRLPDLRPGFQLPADAQRLLVASNGLIQLSLPLVPLAQVVIPFGCIRSVAQSLSYLQSLVQGGFSLLPLTLLEI